MSSPEVLVQFSYDGLPLNRNVFSALEGFLELGWSWKSFTSADLASKKVQLSPENIVVGNIGAVRSCLHEMGFKLPEPIDYPECLTPFFGRKIQRTTWQNALDQLGEEDEFGNYSTPRFIKPTVQKVWTGKVVRNFRDLIEIGNPEKNYPVFISEPVEFLAEYRVYVCEGKILGMKHYSGDSFLVPSKNAVLDMVQAMTEKESIAAYSLDVGVTNFQRTSLVEVNDAYALGNYGLPSVAYAQLLYTRWKQLTSSSVTEFHP